MADSYVEFSEVLSHLQPEEEAWLREQLEVIHLVGEREYTKENLPPGHDPAKSDWCGPRMFRGDADFNDEFTSGFDPDLDQPGFEWRFEDPRPGDFQDWGRHLWLFCEEHGAPWRVAELVQRFLARFRPETYWIIRFAETCSKPRVGAFGGGALFVTAEGIEDGTDFAFLEKAEQAFQARRAGLDIAPPTDANKIDEPEVVINLSGGMVQEVYASGTLGDLTVVDWDVGCGDEGYTEVLHRGEPLRAYVAHPIIYALDRLTGSPVQAVIDAADAANTADLAGFGSDPSR